MSKTFPWTTTDNVPWADGWVFCRGLHNGLPLLSYGCAPRDKLATYRQLRARELRPGGAEHVAYLYFRHNASAKTVFCELFMIEWAVAVRPMTPAKWRAVRKALVARRTCRECGEEAAVELPKADRRCEGCRADVETLEPWSYIHDYLVGTPTLSAAEHQELDEALAAARLAVVIPLQRDRELVAASGQEAVSA